MVQMKLRIGRIRMGMIAMAMSYHSSSFRAIPRPLEIQRTHRSSDEWRLLRWSAASFNYGAKLSRISFNLSGSGNRPGFPLFAPVTILSGVKLQTRASASQVSSSSEGQSEVMDDGKLLKAMVYEAQHEFSNVSGVASRFGEFLYSQLSLRSTSGGDIFASLEKDAKLYDQLDPMSRAQLLDKVAQGMGFFNTQDLISHQFASQEASQDLEESHEDSLKQHSTPPKPESKEAGKSGGVKALRGGLDVKSHEKFHGRQSKPIPSAIKIGSSEPIELYKPHTDRRVESFPLATGSKVNAVNVQDAGSSSSQGNAVIEKAVQQTKKKLSRSPLALASMQVTKTPASSGHDANPVLDTETSNSVLPHVKEKLTELMLMRGAAMYKDCVLDIPVTFIKNLSVYQRSRLEENGFHTLRMLLQHFPRTYVNFQQAGQRVEDGQHLSFVGTIMSSRGLRLSPSLGAIEVIVKSTVDAHDSSDEDQEDGQGHTVFLHLKKFFRGARFTNTWFLNKMAAKYPVHAQVAVGGKVKALPLEDHFEIREFNLELWDQESNDPEALNGAKGVKHELEMTGKPYPVYPAKGGLQPKTLEFCIQRYVLDLACGRGGSPEASVHRVCAGVDRILPALPLDLDPVPKYLRDMYHLVELRQAYFGMHTPQDTEDAERGRQRLVFDEFFYLQLGMLLQRQQLADKYLGNLGTSQVVESGNLEMDKWSPLTLKLVNSLPYTLTNSQKKAASEIMWDLQRPVPMSRLLQGDVGCGKTVVAFLGLLEVIDAGYQGALMAPTEFLAIQHYQRIMGWLEVLEDHERPRVALLTGSTPVAKARIIRSGLESGEIVLAVGTHSLISDSVRFASLGLAVVDEQHRFGVAQRGRLNSKVRESNVSQETAETIEGGEGRSERGESSTIILSAPHVLAMSATPIPRTLALAMHGDMTISQITELPPGRAQTVTQAFHGNNKGRRDAYKMMRKELESGGRVFVVYPVIELSEELPELRAAETEYKILTEEFEDFQCGLVHGRMKAQEKEAAMELFKVGKSQILVSTTVIEVGIDIPEASMIVIEHAERYGMAQLHQLRGRVGRGSRESKCILLGSNAGSLNRLKLLEASSDGFYLAEIDLRLRGPGDLLGKRQSGYIPEFGIARLDQDGEILEHARSAAEDVLRKHHGLKDLPRLKQELSMRRPPMALG